MPIFPVGSRMHLDVCSKAGNAEVFRVLEPSSVSTCRAYLQDFQQVQRLISQQQVPTKSAQGRDSPGIIQAFDLPYINQ